MALPENETELESKRLTERRETVEVRERWKDITAASMAGRAFRMTT